MTVWNVSSCLQLCKNFKNRAFFQSYDLKFTATFFSVHSIYRVIALSKMVNTLVYWRQTSPLNFAEVTPKWRQTCIWYHFRVTSAKFSGDVWRQQTRVSVQSCDVDCAIVLVSRFDTVATCDRRPYTGTGSHADRQTDARLAEIIRSGQISGLDPDICPGAIRKSIVSCAKAQRFLNFHSTKNVHNV